MKVKFSTVLEIVVYQDIDGRNVKIPAKVSPSKSKFLGELLKKKTRLVVARKCDIE